MKNLLRFLSLAAAVVVFFSKAGAETDDPNLKISDIDLPASLAHPYFYGTASAGNILALANNDEVHLHLIGADGVPVFLSKVTVAGLGTSSKVSSLSLCERYLALGVQDDDEGKGVAYLLKLETNGTATLLDQLSEEDAGSFGSSIVVSDDFLVVGARDTAVGINESAGAVYLYKIDGNGKPALLSKQTAPNPYIGFGKFIDQDGESLVITDYKGAYLYHVSEDGKITFLEHLALDGTYFTNVSVSGDLLVISGGEFKDKKASIYQINREETARLVNTMKHGVGVHELTAAIHGDLLAVSSRATGEPNAGTSLYKVETNGTATELMPLRDEGRARSFSDAITVSSKYMVVEGGSNVSDKHRFYVFHNPDWSTTANNGYEDTSDDTSDKEDDDDVVVDVGASSSKVVDVFMQYRPGDGAYGLFLKADGTLWHINGQGRWTGSVAQGNWTEVGSAFDTITPIASEVASIMQDEVETYFIKKDDSLWEYKIGYSGDPAETTGPKQRLEGQTIKFAGWDYYLNTDDALWVKTSSWEDTPYKGIRFIEAISMSKSSSGRLRWVSPEGSLWTLPQSSGGGDSVTSGLTPIGILDSGVSMVNNDFFVKTDGSLWEMRLPHSSEWEINKSPIETLHRVIDEGVKLVASGFIIKDNGSLWKIAPDSKGDWNATGPIVDSGVTRVSTNAHYQTLFCKKDGSLWAIDEGETKPVEILKGVSDAKDTDTTDENTTDTDATDTDKGTTTDDTSDKEEQQDVTTTSSKVIDVLMWYRTEWDAYGLFLKEDGTLWHINGFGHWEGTDHEGFAFGSAFDTITPVSSEVASIMQDGPYFIKKDGSLWEYYLKPQEEPSDTTGPEQLFKGRTFQFAGFAYYLETNDQLLVKTSDSADSAYSAFQSIEAISMSGGLMGGWWSSWLSDPLRWVAPNGSLWSLSPSNNSQGGDTTDLKPAKLIDSGVSMVSNDFFVKTDGSLWLVDGNAQETVRKIMASGVKFVGDSFIIKDDGSLWKIDRNRGGEGDWNATGPIVDSGVTRVSTNAHYQTLFCKKDGSLWAIDEGETEPVMILEFVSDTKNSAGKDTNDSEKLPVADFTIGTDDKDKDKGTTTGSEVTIGTAAIPFSGGTITGGGVVPVGSTVTLSAVPAGNYSFLGWSGDLSGTDNPFTFTANASMTLIANFDRSHEVKALANGGGTVTGGGSYGHNTKATLVAKPATGYRLVSWSGGYGSDASLTITIDSDKTINATFAKDERDNDLDGLTNYEELIDRNTDPNDADSDDDQLPDGKEVEWGLNPKVSNEELVTYVSNLNTGKAPDFSTPNLRSPHTAGWYYQPEWGWMWSSKEVFPYVYRSGSGSHSAGWLFFRDGSFNPIYFYDYVEGKWTTLGTE